MRIGLDARTLFAPQRRGIGRSLLRLYQELARIRPEWEVVAYHRPGSSHAAHDADLPPNFTARCIDLPGDRFDAWLRLRLPFAAWRDGVDLLHCPANAAPAVSLVPTLVTIHDLIPIDLPQSVSVADARRFERGVRTACRRASAIACPSAYTRSRLVEHLGADAARIHVAPWGADPSVVQPEAVLAEATHRCRVTRPYVLHFGAADERKNTSRLIAAWAALAPGTRRRWSLLIIGLDAPTQASLLRLCQKLGVERSVLLHGFVPEHDVAALLQAAELVAYPSLSEGFGLPILEAFAAETAILTSRGTSLPEVAGDAAMFVDPLDTADLTRGLEALMRDEALRTDLAARGLRRLPEFTWRACAERYATTMEAIARRRASHPREGVCPPASLAL